MVRDIRISERMASYVRFARFCQETRITPGDAVVLVTLARRAFKAGEREANTGKSADPQRKAFEDFAKSVSFETRWPGLWPMVMRRGREWQLPID